MGGGRWQKAKLLKCNQRAAECVGVGVWTGAWVMNMLWICGSKGVAMESTMVPN